MGSDAGLQVVIVAYGDPAGLRRCLAALGHAYPVTIVDNSSSPATAALAEEAGAGYLDPGRNLGFAAGVNSALDRLGLPQVDVALVNPDATVDPAALGELHRRLRAQADLACIAPAQHAPGASGTATVCWPFATPADAWVEAVGLGRFRRGWDYVIGSVLVMRGAALADVGGFDEGFFLYAEEEDWQRRATGRGWRVEYAPEVEAEHVGAGTEPDAGRRRLRFHAGVERYVRKWHGRTGWASYRVATVLTALRRAAVARGDGRRDALDLAGLYAAGPRRRARAAGAVPEVGHVVPDLA